MEKEIKLIEEYLDSISEGPVNKIEPEKPKKKEYVDTPKTLEMKILQQRIDSINIVKYYKDLKAERIKPDTNERFVDSADDIFNEMQAAEQSKPWPKLSAVNKRKRIIDFVEKLDIQNSDEVRVELLKMLDDKKIKRSNIQFDSEMNIVSLGDYSLVSKSV